MGRALHARVDRRCASLFSVVKGDMSLVGPRVRLDLDYLGHRSMRYDVALLIRQARAILSRRSRSESPSNGEEHENHPVRVRQAGRREGSY
jgi:hypothetical protein